VEEVGVVVNEDERGGKKKRKKENLAMFLCLLGPLYKIKTG
jgi:hypothetical protein